MNLPDQLPDQAATLSAPARAGGPGTMAYVGLAILVMLAFVSFLDRQIIALMVSPMERDLHIKDAEIGLLQGPAFALMYPLFAVPIGYAADRYSRRWVIFWSVTLWALAAMGSGLANSYSVLFAARAGVGLGEAAVQPAVASLLSDIFPRRRLATVFSIYGSGSILGSAGALAIGGAVISMAKGGLDVPVLGHLEAWQIAFIVTGAPAALLACAIFLVPEPPRRRSDAPGAAAAAPSWGEVFVFVRARWLYLFCYVIGQSLLILVTLGVWTWQPVVMERSYGWTPLQIGSALGIFTVAFGFTGQLSNGLIVDRLFVKHRDAHLRYYLIASPIIVACGCLAALAPNVLTYLLILGPMKFLLNFAGVFIAALQVATPARLRGRLTALSTVITQVLGYSLGPWVVAVFTDHLFHDPNKVIWSSALTTALAVPLAAVCFAVGLKPMREAVAAETAAEVRAAAS